MLHVKRRVIKGFYMSGYLVEKGWELTPIGPGLGLHTTIQGREVMACVMPHYSPYHHQCDGRVEHGKGYYIHVDKLEKWTEAILPAWEV
ncbi:MAG: hypothetical protein ACW99G_05055 [Candidatus Thorarchaeota archaeon]|jgi:hypothetical protein